MAADNTRKEVESRVYGCRMDGAWLAINDWIDMELEQLRTRLESTSVEEIKKMQGRVFELRKLRKVMLGQTSKERE